MCKPLLVLLVVAFVLPLASAQNPPSADDSASRDAALDLQEPTLRITTREVLVDLVAIDRHNQPVLDLKPDELQVSSVAEADSKKNRKGHAQDPVPPASVVPITHLSIFDPNNSSASSHHAPSGFRILASCLERSTTHYLLAFHPGPDAWTSGFHRIAITTARSGTKLFYRHQYYVGLSAPSPANSTPKPGRIDQILQQSACYYPVDPLSIALHARLINTGRTDVVRYLVSVDASSLSFLTLNSDPVSRASAGFDRRVEVDYGTCNFDAAGKPVSYFHAPLDKVLNSADYARALDRGFPHILEFPAPGHIALSRIVLRDRATGNLGVADVILPATQQPSEHAAREMTGSFGSIVPAPHSFCGDVYELPEPSEELPNFRELDPIGSIYTANLNVHNQYFSNSSGIPGVTPRTNLFGIDYHASFWVQAPGDYEFRMASDDGALLQIDDQQIINLDGLQQVNEGSGHIHLDAGAHTIHVPYYQGAPVSVALELWVKPPGAAKWSIFDLNDHQPPASPPAGHH